MKNKKVYILFSILIALFCAAMVSKRFQNDTFSAIRIGDYIIHNGIDFVEHFNFNELTYHNARWLFNVILAFVYNNFNYLGVYIFTILNSIALGLIMFNALLKKNKNLFISLVVTLLAVFFAKTYLVARAQIMSYSFLFLEVIFIEKLMTDNKKRYIIPILIMSVLIANIHTTIWPMTLILFLPYFAEYILSKRFKYSNVLYSETNIKLLSIAFALTAISGLLTPLGLLPYTYMYKTMSGISSEFITELQKVNIFKSVNMLTITISYIVLFLFIRKKIKISDIFMVSGLFFMSIMAARNIPFFVIIGAISFSRLVIDNMDKYYEKFNRVLESFYKDIIIMFLISFCVVTLSVVFFITSTYKRQYVDETFYPTKASDYIMENIDLDNLRIFNGFNYGAYLEFRGIKVFLDSRSEVYCEEFNDTTILKDWYEVTGLKVDYKEIFAKYDFNYIMLYKKENLYKPVSQDSDYNCVYEDDYFALYEKVE